MIRSYEKIIDNVAMSAKKKKNFFMYFLTFLIKFNIYMFVCKAKLPGNYCVCSLVTSER